MVEWVGEALASLVLCLDIFVVPRATVALCLSGYFPMCLQTAFRVEFSEVVQSASEMICLRVKIKVGILICQVS